jgi:hypothetical protein
MYKKPITEIKYEILYILDSIGALGILPEIIRNQFGRCFYTLADLEYPELKQLHEILKIKMYCIYDITPEQKSYLKQLTLKLIGASN